MLMGAWMVQLLSLEALDLLLVLLWGELIAAESRSHEVVRLL